MNKNTVCLWYDGTALDAATFLRRVSEVSGFTQGRAYPNTPSVSAAKVR